MFCCYKMKHVRFNNRRASGLLFYLLTFSLLKKLEVKLVYNDISVSGMLSACLIFDSSVGNAYIYTYCVQNDLLVEPIQIACNFNEVQLISTFEMELNRSLIQLWLESEIKILKMQISCKTANIIPR